MEWFPLGYSTLLSFMRVLFTSDWQADYSNLDTLQVVVEEILSLKNQLGFDALVHCGDVKHMYNPVDVRVINFVLRSFGKFKKAGLGVFVDLGNHDRVGMHVDKQNWLPILRKAGAMAYDEPAIAEVDGGAIHFLPFRNDLVLLKREASDLGAKATGKRCILVFHAELANSQYNALTQSQGALTVEDLVADRYLFCIGGHIHLPQKVSSNVYYVGSPFASDWGEANQKKGYLLVDFETGKLSRVLSKIPGWYDPQWPRFEQSKPTSWKGTKVRIKVPVADARQLVEELERAKKKAETTYEGAEVVVIPEFAESTGSDKGIRTEWPDKKKIDRYTKETLPQHLVAYRPLMNAYLLEQLEQAGGVVREGGELKFHAVTAKNFLSFEEINWRIEKGLHVITGKNMDWNRSNGAGKTSWLQPIAVALFGSTFKGQKHDRWVRRGVDSKQESWVGITLADSQNRAVVVFRRRLPKPQLILRINQQMVDSGNRSDQTQKMIEQITGYTWETLSNAIYIDQSKTHLVLTGTETERKEFLARLQNLERFEKAKRLVKNQRLDYESRLERLHNKRDSAISLKQDLHQSILETESVHKPTGKEQKVVASTKAALKDTVRRKALWEKIASGRRATAMEKIEGYRTRLEEFAREQGKVAHVIFQCKQRLETFKHLKGTCHTCEQPISVRHIEKQVPLLEKEIEENTETWTAQKESIDELRALQKEQEKVYQHYQRNLGIERLVAERTTAYNKAVMELDQALKTRTLVRNLEERRVAVVEHLKVVESRMSKITKWLSLLDYAEQVFSRSGLPAYLNAQLVPELNQAATEYSELFAQGEIQVRFQVDTEGRMDVQIINAHGGEGVHDQSEGEMKMASLITSFAVRQAAPKTNLLILDEPGDGLDPISAKQFARGIRQLTDKFCTILLVTHNPSILAELGEENQITIVKENGISRMDNE